MMRLLRGFALFCLLLSLSAGMEQAFVQAQETNAGPPEGTITVFMSGLRNNQGVVRVALFGSQETYNNDHNVGMGSFRKVVVPVVNNQAVASFSEMPYGDYAVKFFHDGVRRRALSVLLHIQATLGRSRTQ